LFRGQGASPISANQQAFNDLKTYLEPTSVQSVALPTEPDLAAVYDFHKMIAALGDYPNLLRTLGLVVDLEVTLPAALPADPGLVSVIPTLPTATPTTHYSPRTHYRLSDERFIARPRPANPEISEGLLRLDDPSLFQVQQVDVAGGGIKLQNTATNIVGIAFLGEQPANAPEESGLPALQTAGISIVRPEKAEALQQAFVKAYALNVALATVDGSPVFPSPAASRRHPPTTSCSPKTWSAATASTSGMTRVPSGAACASAAAITTSSSRPAAARPCSWPTKLTKALCRWAPPSRSIRRRRASCAPTNRSSPGMAGASARPGPARRFCPTTPPASPTTRR
jgi:hypothetical protein